MIPDINAINPNISINVAKPDTIAAECLGLYCSIYNPSFLISLRLTDPILFALNAFLLLCREDFITG